AKPAIWSAWQEDSGNRPCMALIVVAPRPRGPPPPSSPERRSVETRQLHNDPHSGELNLQAWCEESDSDYPDKCNEVLAFVSRPEKIRLGLSEILTFIAFSISRRRNSCSPDCGVN